jgi:hypothetical protein
VHGTDLVQKLADREDLTDGPDEEVVAWLEIDERLASFDIDHTQTPNGTLIDWPVKDGSHFGGNACRVGKVLCAGHAGS